MPHRIFGRFDRFIALRWRTATIIGVVVIVLAAVSGWYILQRATQHRALVAELARYEQAQRDNEDNAKHALLALKAFSNAISRADESSQRRHDNSVSADPSATTILIFAKQEAKELRDADRHFSDIIISVNRFVKINGAVFGDETLNQYRVDARTYIERENIYIDDSQRAIGDIIDNVEIAIRGDDPPVSESTIEGLYHESDLAYASLTHASFAL